MRNLSANPSVLLCHDGELADCRALLEELGVDFCDRIGAVPVGSDARTLETGDEHRDLVIATPRRLLDLCGQTGRSPHPTRIAVVDGDSRTLRAHLRRIGVDFIVRRPVHPAALRLLILHEIYRGPERRRRDRVSIGAEVHFRTGLRRQRATLVELSIRGGRLLARKSVRAGRSIRVHVPASLGPRGAGRAKLRACVVRCDALEGETPPLWTLAVRFDDLTPASSRQLQAILDSHREGPASERSARANGSAPRRTPPLPPQATGVVAPRVDSGRADEGRATTPAEPEASASNEHPRAEAERREEPRRPYPKHIVALSEQATRVLIGRDISSGGMRVAAGSRLALGEHLRIALHCVGHPEPLVLHALVARDDGDAGLVLAFESLEEKATAELARLIEYHPIVLGDREEGAESGGVISEILTREHA